MDMNELLSFCFMSPLAWDKFDLFSAPNMEKKEDRDNFDAMNLSLVIHQLSCQYVSPLTVGGTASPIVIIYVNGDGQWAHKSKAAKKTIFPVWKVDWKLYVNSFMNYFYFDVHSFMNCFYFTICFLFRFLIHFVWCDFFFGHVHVTFFLRWNSGM